MNQCSMCEGHCGQCGRCVSNQGKTAKKIEPLFGLGEDVQQQQVRMKHSLTFHYGHYRRCIKSYPGRMDVKLPTLENPKIADVLSLSPETVWILG